MGLIILAIVGGATLFIGGVFFALYLIGKGLKAGDVP